MSKASKKVIVLETSVPGKPFILRSNPTNKAAVEFVKEQDRRLSLNIAAGPSDGLRPADRGYMPPRKIISAKRYENELAYRRGEDPLSEIKLPGR